MNRLPLAINVGLIPPPFALRMPGTPAGEMVFTQTFGTGPPENAFHITAQLSFGTRAILGEAESPMSAT
jgi:hypothetical protein